MSMVEQSWYRYRLGCMGNVSRCVLEQKVGDDVEGVDEVARCRGVERGSVGAVKGELGYTKC